MIRQAEDQMYEVKNDLSRLLSHDAGPLVTNLVCNKFAPIKLQIV